MCTPFYIVPEQCSKCSRTVNGAACRAFVSFPRIAGSGNEIVWKPFSYPEPFLRAVRRGALAKSISNCHLIGYNERCCSNTGYILLPCFYGIRFWPEPLVAPRVRRALGTRMCGSLSPFSYPEPFLRAARRGALAKSITGYHENMVIEYIRY